MALVDMHDVLVLRTQQDSVEVARILDALPEDFVKLCRHFAGDNRRQLCLAQSRSSYQKAVVELFGIGPRSFKGHSNLGSYAFLPDDVFQGTWRNVVDFLMFRHGN